jgi:uncharacterized protein (TIGR03435 family)
MMESQGAEMVTHYFGITMGQLATFVLGSAGRPIQDKTGLTVKYDITIQKPMPASSPEGGPQPMASPADAELSPFSVVEQLGLKLQPERGTVETLVIDHIERPSEN